MFGRTKRRGLKTAERAIDMLQVGFLGMRFQTRGAMPDKASTDDFLIAYVLGCYTMLALIDKLNDAEYFQGLESLFQPFFPLTYQELPYEIPSKRFDRKFQETSKLAVSESLEMLKGNGALNSLQKYIEENY